MDYSKVKFVTPSVGCKYFTKGKVYAMTNLGGAGGFLIDDNGHKICVYFPECQHLDGAHWIPCHEDGTPLTKELAELEVEMLAMLEEILDDLMYDRSCISIKEIEKLIKKAKQ